MTITAEALCPSTWTGVAALEVAAALQEVGPVFVTACGPVNYRVFAGVGDALVRVSVIADSPMCEDGCCYLPVAEEPAIRYKVAWLAGGRHGRTRTARSLDEAMAAARRSASKAGRGRR